MNTTVIGAFPKISDDPGGQELRRGLHRLDRGEIDAKAIESVVEQVTRAAIREMETAGIDVINDGQIRWDDLFSPFAKAWKGVSRGPLERFYDNNTYFRQPVIEGKIETDGRTLTHDLALALSIAKQPVKAAVCGPLTFATLTAEDKAYGSLEERTLAIADALAVEVKALGAAGATLVDVEDPALVALPQHIELAREAYLRIAAAGVDIAVQTFFFPADRILEFLASFPVAQVGLDVRSRDTTVLRRLDVFKDKTVVLGVVDARNTRLETTAEVASLIQEALKLVPEDRLWVAPTTGLEYLPHDIASKKLAALVSGAREALGRVEVAR
jgi:5-methyltetrahydropteroyltriglutamate--homocysteine methyltransferase